MKTALTLLFSFCMVWGESSPMALAADPNPTAISVGKGSYAAFPPPEAGAGAQQMLQRPLYLVGEGNRPIPTNQWWTNLLVDRYAGQLWAYPHQVTADAQGLNLFFPIQWNLEGRDVISNFPLAIRGKDFKPADARAKNWGDWTLTLREAESADKYWDVTLGRGLPYLWIECHGVAPVINLGAGASFFEKSGKAATFPVTGDHLGIQYGGRNYGVFAPDNTQFTLQGNAISCEFTGKSSYLVLCPLPSPEDLAYFYQFAFAVPRDSRMDWTYDPDKAQVTTQWHLTTELLKGSEHRLIQGWIPHHYRDTVNDLVFSKPQYVTPRGLMKCAVGTDFKLVYPFNGFPPMLPAPKPTGLPHDFDAARMHDYLTRYATRTDFGNDTYWGGKQLLQAAQYMAMAQQLGDPSFAKLRDSLRVALTDWFTYTPGEKAHYFARYPRWRALVGFQPSYGSEQFNDHQFHYGYFTTAAALLGMHDPRFLEDYGGMARLVAKEYANWDRKDTDFPFLRTFDIWEGHSWAGGFSSPTGNNQESSSEAVQSWGGLFLLGSALGDKEMTAAGAMGHALETHATREYWFNVHGDNFSPNYKNPIVGMVWGGGQLYGTYFSDDPAWIFGIQWLPMSPALSYLAQDPEFARKSLATMLADRKRKKGTDTISSMGAGLGNVVLSYAQLYDPDKVAEQMDALWESKDPVARENDTGGLTYYFTHANRALGSIQWDYHLSQPTSCVYYHPGTKIYRSVVFNPKPTPQTVTVYKKGQKMDALFVSPNHLQVFESQTLPTPK